MAIEDIALSESLAAQIQSLITATTTNARLGSGTAVDIELRHEVDSMGDVDRANIKINVTQPVLIPPEYIVPCMLVTQSEPLDFSTLALHKTGD